MPASANHAHGHMESQSIQPTQETSGRALNAVEGAVFALLGLLLAFALSGALQRFDERRQLILQEANAIRAAYDRLDVLEGDARHELKAELKEYLNQRLELYRLPITFFDFQRRIGLFFGATR